VTVHVVLRYASHKTALLIIPIYIKCYSFPGLFNWCLNFFLMVKSNVRHTTMYLDDIYICWTSLSCHFYKNHRMLWKLPVLLASGRIQKFCEI
jgi:hypothetical protein